MMQDIDVPALKGGIFLSIPPYCRHRGLILSVREVNHGA